MQEIYSKKGIVMAEPCVHGDLCRAYIRNFRVIYCDTCPSGCKFYKPKSEDTISRAEKEKWNYCPYCGLNLG